jgi:hypothetical protein
MTTATAHERHELKERLRDEMRGRWRELLPVHEFQTGRKYPCPRCVGTDRFNLGDDFEATGAVWCRNCFADRNANPPNHADGFSSLMWWHGCDFPQAFQMVKDHLGYFDEEGPRIELSPPPEMIEVYCRQRNIPGDALKAFGARLGRRPTNEGGPEVDCIEVPLYSSPGVECGLFDLSPYLSWLKKGKARKGSANGLFIPSAGLQPGTVYIVEGVKDAATLHYHGCQAVGIQGTPGRPARQAFQALFTEEAGPFSVVMVPDLDRGGDTNAEKVAEMVDGLPGVSSFSVARLPGAWKESGGVDVRDSIQAYGWEAVKIALDNPKPPAKDERPTVYQREDEAHELCVESMKALAALGWSASWIPEDERERVKVYHQRGQLVEVIHGRPTRLVARGFELDSGPIVRRIPSETLAAWLGRACRFRKEVRKLNKDTNELETESHLIEVPPKVVKHLLNDRQLAWDHLPELKGVVSAPILRPDGTIFQTPGYDERSKYLLAAGDYFPIPETPTLADAQSAAGLLLDLVDEFPFEGPSDSAAWLAYLLTLIARPAIQGATPVWAFNANQAGSGKTLLADLAHRIAFGRTVPIKTVDPETPGGKAEMRNEITACVVEGLPAVLWDNVRGRIASPQFEAAVTALTWSARLYHSNSENITEPMRIVFAVTGNNLEIGGDSSRRWIACELLSADERPECRQFKRSRIREYVNENRQKYVAAALTILRYRWSVGTMDRGSLQAILPLVGSFEGWSAVVRDSVYLATDLDPWSTNEKVRAFDADADTLDLIHEALRGRGWTSAEIVDEATSEGGGYVSQMLEAIGCGANPTAQKVGKRLKPFLRRPRNGWRLIENKVRGGLSRWSVVPVPRSLPLEATEESPPDERKPPF